MKMRDNGLRERLYSLRVGEDLEIVSVKNKIMVLDRGVIVCITDSWINAIDYIEQVSQMKNN